MISFHKIYSNIARIALISLSLCAAADEERKPLDTNAVQSVFYKIERTIFRNGEKDLLKFYKKQLDTFGPHSVDEKGQSILHIVAAYNYSDYVTTEPPAFCRFIKIAEYFLQKGATPNLCDKAGSTPLHICVRKSVEHTPELAQLLCTPLNLNLQNKRGETPLHSAAGNSGHKIMIPLLLSKGADPLIKDHDGKTAYDHLVAYEKEITIELLHGNSYDREYTLPRFKDNVTLSKQLLIDSMNKMHAQSSEAVSGTHESPTSTSDIADEV